MHTPQAATAKQMELANKVKPSLFGQHENYEGKKIILWVLLEHCLFLKKGLWSWTNYQSTSVTARCLGHKLQLTLMFSLWAAKWQEPTSGPGRKWGQFQGDHLRWVLEVWAGGIQRLGGQRQKEGPKWRLQFCSKRKRVRPRGLFHIAYHA